MDSENIQLLEKLRTDVLTNLTDMSDQLANSEDASYELLLMLSRNAQNPRLLQTAYEKIIAMNDPDQKADGLLALLDEIEIQLSDEQNQLNRAEQSENDQLPTE